MHRKIKLIFIFSAFALTMCRSYATPVSTMEGLSCRTYTAYFQDGLESSKGVECTYTCPNGTIAGPFEFDTDPSLWATKGDLDRQLCGIAPATFTPAKSAANASPTPDLSSTPAASPTLSATATVEPSPTVEITPTAQEPLLTGRVLMCDVGANLINFRIVQPAPDLTGKTITAQINDTESMCAVNPTNPSLLTCTIPTGVTFPARVVVSLDGAVVNDFVYDGTGCAEITTPVVTTTP
jgi:hypothetical protein